MTVAPRDLKALGMSHIENREFFVIANWFGDWPSVMRCRVIESSADSPTALVRSGDLVKVVSIGMVFGEEWRAHDALADLCRIRMESAQKAASACWTGKNRPVRLRAKGGA